jgi:hypothetical protein
MQRKYIFAAFCFAVSALLYYAAHIQYMKNILGKTQKIEKLESLNPNEI